jgi:hypothetical protein
MLTTQRRTDERNNNGEAVVADIDLERRSGEGSRGAARSAGKKRLQGTGSSSEQRILQVRTRKTRGGAHRRRGGSKRR